MKIRQHLLFAFTGWTAGAFATLLCGLIGPLVFPGLVQVSHYSSPGPGLPFVVGAVLVVVSPVALVGGLIGGRLPKEGGRQDQILSALIFGALAALPFGCVVLWFFSGP